MKFIATLILLTIFTSCGIDELPNDNDGDNGNSSGWEKVWGGGASLSTISIGPDGTILVGGLTLGDLYATNVGIDAIVVAFSSIGKELWGKQLSLVDDENEVEGLVVDNSGNIYAAGGWSDSFIIKCSADGEKIWEEFPESDDVSCLTIDKSNNIYAGTGYGYVLKYSSEGTSLKTYNSLSSEFGETGVFSLKVDPNGNLYVGGTTMENLFTENAGETDAFLVKIAPDGTHLWEKQWGGSNQDAVRALVYDEVDDVIYAAGGGNFIMKKFSAKGDELWTIDGQGILSLTMDNEGNIYAGSGASASLVEKYNSKGEKLWGSKVYEDALAYGIACDGNGNVYAAGEKDNNNFLIKIPASEMK